MMAMLRFSVGLMFVLSCTCLVNAQKQADESPDNKPTVPTPDYKRTAHGPKEWFDKPLPGVKPAAQRQEFFKTAIVHVPNPGLDADDCANDLPKSKRYGFVALRLKIDQTVDYNQCLFTDRNRNRERRTWPRASVLGSPRVGDAEVGKTYAGLEFVGGRMGAQVVIAISALPGENDVLPRAGAGLYRVGKGLTSWAEFDLTPPAKPEPSSLITKVKQASDIVFGGLPLANASVPELCLNDKALKAFVKFVDKMALGELEDAWVAFEELRRIDPDLGRAATYGIELFHQLANRQTDADSRREYMGYFIETARKGLEQTPNDVMLRGRVAILMSQDYQQDKWALNEIVSARKLQPWRWDLIEWERQTRFPLSRKKQAEWLVENVLPHRKDGMVELSLGNIEFNSNRLENALKWYAKGASERPNEHEIHISKGLCASAWSVNLHKAAPPGASGEAFRKQANEAADEGAKAFGECLRIDPTERAYVYQYYLQAATRKYKLLPVDESKRYQLFLVAAVFNGLRESSKFPAWNKLTSEFRKTYKRFILQDAKSAKPDHPKYELYLMARMQFALGNNDTVEGVATLKLMRKFGHRSDIFDMGESAFGALLDK